MVWNRDKRQTYLTFLWIITSTVRTTKYRYSIFDSRKKSRVKSYKVKCEIIILWAHAIIFMFSHSVDTNWLQLSVINRFMSKCRKKIWFLKYELWIECWNWRMKRLIFDLLSFHVWSYANYSIAIQLVGFLFHIYKMKTSSCCKNEDTCILLSQSRSDNEYNKNGLFFGILNFISPLQFRFDYF